MSVIPAQAGTQSNNKLPKGQYFIFLCFCIFIPLAQLTYAQQPAHEHNGILTPYIGEPERIQLSEKEIRRLQKGNPLFKKQLVGKSKRAVAIFHVQANPSTVWSVIKDFEHYPGWIVDIKATDIYRREGSEIYVRFDAKSKYAGKSTWFARHDYPDDDRDWGTWTLDYDHLSDLDDSVGYWRVSPLQENPEHSIVVYSASLKLKSKIPSFIIGFIVKARLKQATLWVREQAELRKE